MHITFSPQRSDAALTVIVEGEALVINGTRHDFSGITEPTEVPEDYVQPIPEIAGPVERKGGRLHLVLILPLAAAAPEEARFPEPVIDPPDGVLVLPDHGAGK